MELDKSGFSIFGGTYGSAWFINVEHVVSIFVWHSGCAIGTLVVSCYISTIYYNIWFKIVIHTISYHLFLYDWFSFSVFVQISMLTS